MTAAVYCLLLSAVDEEHDADDEGEERFELEEVLPVGAPRLVAGERVEREGAEEDADAEPDELSLPVPHAASEALQLAQPVGGGFERLVPFAEAGAHLARAEFGAAVKARAGDPGDADPLDEVARELHVVTEAE